MTALFWEVVLANGTVVREPPDNASIRTAPQGAVELRVIDERGTVVHRLGLRDEFGRAVKPVFYRRRYQDARAPAGSARTGATVFGWGRETDASVDGFLWAAVDGKIVACPERLRDPVMVELQITR